MTERSVLVTGDQTLNWLLAESQADPSGPASEPLRRTNVGAVAGGAALVSSLLRDLFEASSPDAPVVVAETPSGPGAVAFTDSRFHQSFSTCRRVPRRVGERESVWRVHDFLGLQLATDAVDLEGSAQPAQPAQLDVVVIEDANLGFREQPGRWPDGVLQTPERGGSEEPWIVLRSAAPVADGDLWRALQRHADRLIVVIGMEDLRLTDIRISRELSWERTAGDVAREILHHPSVNTLTRCAHVVVSLGTGGAVVLSHPDGAPAVAPDEQTLIQPDCHVLFDPEAIEDSWREQRPGRMLDETSCLVAAITRAIIVDASEPDVRTAVRQGLAAQRALHETGYRMSASELGRPGLEFPFVDVVEALRRDPGEFSEAHIDFPVPDEWSILEAHYPDGLEAVAEAVALHGVDAALTGVPIGRFGALLTVDRGEIESFRSLRALIREYDSEPAPRPLNVAVFGPPGAGKSFGVKAVAKAVLGADHIESMTFNLSQMSGPADLLDSLHRVRDAGLRGRLPLVLWDEFDASLDGVSFGWLHHFLAPMQDGEFQQGQLVHPIGKAIFVFAGGTSATSEAFASNTTDEFRLAKGPDFVSRLRGHVDIVGPDPRGGDTDADPFFRIRRAILLRTMLLRDRPGLFGRPSKTLDIDPGVLRAFLEVPAYRHGARSIETVIAMSTLHGAHRYERSALPATDQLDAHVDARQFMRLVEEYVPDGDVLERLARAVHAAYREELDAPEWDDLPEHLRQMNRAAARDIPRKLAVLGCVLESLPDAAPMRFKQDDPRIERLARYEHERWVTRKLKTGWRYGETRDDVKRVHPSIRPWAELPTAERNKDRLAVLALPRVVHEAGMSVARIDGAAEVAVGVVGHRVLADTERVTAGIDEAFARITESFHGRPMSLVSELAEGADRLALDYALTHPETRVVAVLPLPRHEYARDFVAETSKAAFDDLLAIADEVVELPCAPERDQAYAAAGEELLRRSQALLVVWDGKAGNGPGGTADLVERARDRGLPIAWVHAGNREPGTEVATTLGVEQGRVTYERFSS